MILQEIEVEDLICEVLEEIGYKKLDRFNENDLQLVIDYKLLKEKLMLINSNLHEDYIDAAILKIKRLNYANAMEGNVVTLQWLKSGIPIKIEKHSIRELPVRLIDFENIDNNTFGYIRQFEIVEHQKKQIPDIVIFINGLPLSIIELKAPEALEKLEDAYNQVKNYAHSHLNLIYWNVFSLVSNAFFTKYGPVTSDFSHWYSWKRINVDSNIEQDIDYQENDNQALDNYRKNIIGIFTKATFLNILEHYIFIANSGHKQIKYVPAYHQYFAVEKAIKSIEHAKYGRGGVVWHTQGSGKSVTMLFLAARIRSYFKDKNYKIIYVTDRNELDDQLYKRFCEASSTYLFQEPKKIESRTALKDVLSDDDDFGIYMTTIQKFTEDTSVLSKKDNVIIIADEAHRSHNNVETDFTIKENEIIEKEGYAKYIRDAFPNAIFLGFTGTPLRGDKKTTDIFGDYIDTYTMNQAVLDCSTVPIQYEKRKIKIFADETKLKELDEIYNEEKNESDSDYINNAKYEHIKKKLMTMSNLLSDPDVIERIVRDFWQHYDTRSRALNGKAMFVAFNRDIAFAIYKEMIKQRPQWEEKIKLVITGSNKDSPEMAKLIPNEDQKKKLASEFKKSDSNFKIAIVVDMWLTGFDVPDLDTLYLFKIIKWHNLMQTIARVNRTYREGNKVKEDGLVVDYMGIWKHIAEALKDYANDTNAKFDIEEVKKAVIDKSMLLKKKFFDGKGLVEEWVEGNKSQKFEALIKSANVIMSLDSNQKDFFFNVVSRIARWYKLCSQSLEPIHKLEAQLYIMIRNFIRTQNVEEAIDVQKTIERLKEKMNEIITTGDVEISTIQLESRKDIAYISMLLEKEIKLIKEGQTPDAIKLKSLENELKSEIKNFSKRSPLKAQELSKDLKHLVEKYESDKNLEEFMTGLFKMSKYIIQETQELEEMGGDTELQAFYSILANDQFRTRNYSSEILREIAREVMSKVKELITPQWWTNPGLRDKISSEIKKLLLVKYNYPPKDATSVSKILIDELNGLIKDNRRYFIQEEDR